MNERQIKLIETVEKHLAQEVSLEQMRAWLTENIKPTVRQSAGAMRPGLWLELHTYRTLRNHIDDLQDPTISRRSNLDWYWSEVRQILDLLLGNKIYKHSEYWLEFPLSHKKREGDKWMFPFLEYVEEVIRTLTTAPSKGKTELNLPKTDLVFEANPLSAQNGPEILMEEMLNIINDYEELITPGAKLPDHFYSIDLKSAQLSRLEKLTKCYKGELYYSVSATFTGLDKLIITILI